MLRVAALLDVMQLSEIINRTSYDTSDVSITASSTLTAQPGGLRSGLKTLAIYP